MRLFVHVYLKDTSSLAANHYTYTNIDLLHNCFSIRMGSQPDLGNQDDVASLNNTYNVLYILKYNYVNTKDAQQARDVETMLV